MWFGFGRGWRRWRWGRGGCCCRGRTGGTMAVSCCGGRTTGMLYLSTGDRQAPGDPGNWGQRGGRVLRFGVAARCRGVWRLAVVAGVPGDNPFVGMEGVRPEIWAYGLRNPWRMVFHPVTGELWTGDNGDESWEHVRRVGRGTNHGWSAFEGSHPFRLGNVLGGPVTELTATGGGAPAQRECGRVIGGLFYRGRAMPQAGGALPVWRLCDEADLGGELRRWGGWKTGGGRGCEGAGGGVCRGQWTGEVIVTSHDGKLYRMREAGAAAGAQAVAGDAGGDGVVRGRRRACDGGGCDRLWDERGGVVGRVAVKERFLALPEGGKMRVAGGIDAHKSWELPEGGLVGQTLSLAGQRVETQLLYYDGTWRGFTYKWRADGREADLVVDGGEEVEVEVEVPEYGVQAWRFASRGGVSGVSHAADGGSRYR